MEKFDHYVYGRHVTVHNDHKPLQSIAKKSMLMAPKRLQKMLLQLQRYTFDLEYVPGNKMQVADTLSRAACATTKSDFEKELETVCVVDNRISDPLLEKVAIETQRDETLQTVKELILNGWPNDKSKVPPQARPYYPVRDELVTTKNVIYKSNRCVIPSTMRRDMMERVHSSHMGIEATPQRVRETIYWPQINMDVRHFIEACDACQSYSRRQPKETLMQHNPLERIWEKVGIDLFMFDHRDYVIIVDYFTNYWEIDHLSDNTTSVSVIKK